VWLGAVSALLISHSIQTRFDTSASSQRFQVIVGITLSVLVAWLISARDGLEWGLPIGLLLYSMAVLTKLYNLYAIGQLETKENTSDADEMDSDS
jgi:hypothetical protein